MSARKLTAFLLVYVAAVTFLSTGCATNSPAGQNTKAATAGFSFAVFGDSRTMMYLPHRSDQKADAVNYMVDMFELVMPEKTAREAVAKAVKLTYDPASGELVQIVLPFMTKSEVTTLTVDQGWVTEASVDDVQLLPGVRRTMFRLAGGDWVTHELVKTVKSGQADFALHTGDWVWWGKQGGKPSENPYWSRVKDVLL